MLINSIRSYIKMLNDVPNFERFKSSKFKFSFYLGCTNRFTYNRYCCLKLNSW